MRLQASRPTLQGVLDVVGALLVLATAIAFVPAAPWPIELATHFRVQYAALLGGVGVGVALARRWVPAALFLVAAAANLAVIAPLYAGGSVAHAAAASPRLRLMFTNVLMENRAHARVLDAIRAADPDVVVAAEIDAAWWDALRAGLPEHRFTLADPRADNFGIGLLSRVPLAGAEIAYLGSLGVPTVIAGIPLGARPVTLLATHTVPPVSPSAFRERNAHLAELARRVRGATGPAVVLGDLNVTPFSPWFADLLRDADLRDSLVGHGPQGSWPADLRVLRIPIDHCLVSPAIRILDRWVGPPVGSDHLPVVVDLDAGG